MATLIVDGSELVLQMSDLEKAEGFHRDIRVPLASVKTVRAVEDAWPELRGIRAPGTGLPGVIAVGTRRGPSGKDFAVVHGRGEAVVVDLEGSDWDRFVVTTQDAESVAAEIRRHLMPTLGESPAPTSQ